MIITPGEFALWGITIAVAFFSAGVIFGYWRGAIHHDHHKKGH